MQLSSSARPGVLGAACARMTIGGRRSMETNSRKILRKLQEDGWQVVRVSGDHHILQHPNFAHSIVVPHPKKDLPRGLVRRIYKDAGWRP